MTTAAMGWFLAGICFAALIILWFSLSYRDLSSKRSSLESIREQVAMHRRLLMQERGEPHDASAQNILSSKLLVYNEMAKAYDAALRTPMNRLPAYLMGFRPVGKGGDR